MPKEFNMINEETSSHLSNVRYSEKTKIRCVFMKTEKYNI